MKFMLLEFLVPSGKPEACDNPSRWLSPALAGRYHRKEMTETSTPAGVPPLCDPCRGRTQRKSTTGGGDRFAVLPPARIVQSLRDYRNHKKSSTEKGTEKGEKKVEKKVRKR